MQVELRDVFEKKIDHTEQVLNRNARSHINTNGRVVLDKIQHFHHSPNFAVSVQQPHVQQPSTYAKPEATSALLGS